jgi:hypothetical protein
MIHARAKDRPTINILLSVVQALPALVLWCVIVKAASQAQWVNNHMPTNYSKKKRKPGPKPR